MPYITEQELENYAGGAERLTQLADWDGDGNRDAVAVNAAISNAEGFVDPYLRLRSSTPIAVPNVTLKRLVGEEAIYFLQYSRGGLAVSDFDKNARMDRIKLLEAHRDGKLRLDEPMPGQSSAVRAAFVENDGDVSREGTKGMW